MVSEVSNAAFAKVPICSMTQINMLGFADWRCWAGTCYVDGRVSQTSATLMIGGDTTVIGFNEKNSKDGTLCFLNS